MRIRHYSFICLLAWSLGLLLSCGGCSDHQSTWREQTLPSGSVVKVTSFHLTMGMEHEERFAKNDAFALEFVYSTPDAGDEAREKQAKDVFELIRPISEQWGFKTASLAGFPSGYRKGKYDQFLFQRQADGRWSCKRTAAKVFAND